MPHALTGPRAQPPSLHGRHKQPRGAVVGRSRPQRLPAATAAATAAATPEATAASASGRTRQRPPAHHAAAGARPCCNTASAQHQPPGTAHDDTVVDFAVVGSGIIGLLTCRQLLLADDAISVALLDAKRPCAGATGAGQGYIWMAHRDPGSPGWALARHSKALWERLAGQDGGASPALRAALEWQPNGSLLLGTTDAEVAALQARASKLQQHGLPGVVLLSPRELAMLEPALHLPPGSRGLLVKSDAQINGRAAAFALLDECQRLAAARRGGGSSRLSVVLQEGMQHMAPLGAQGGVELATSRRRVCARRGVVVAAGVWSGQLLADATGNPAWGQLLQPRRGHLLEVAPPPGMPALHTGMMEQSYTQHYNSTSAGSGGSGGSGGGPDSSSSSSAVDITFTATTSASGSLLIGSSREFSGYEATHSPAIIAAIMERAATFLPALAAVSSSALADTTRVGLRPYAVGGLPAVGPVPSLPGVVVAAGHEGSGLCLGPATAALVARHLGLAREHVPPDGDLLCAAEALLPEARLLATR